MDQSHGRILIVEDQPLQSMALAELIEELGFETIGPAQNASTALQLLTEHEVDIALLDINLDGKTSFAIADKLISLGKPMIFTSGLSSDDLDGRYPDVPLITKPWREEDLVRSIVTILEQTKKPHISLRSAVG